MKEVVPNILKGPTFTYYMWILIAKQEHNRSCASSILKPFEILDF